MNDVIYIKNINWDLQKKSLQVILTRISFSGSSPEEQNIEHNL